MVQVIGSVMNLAAIEGAVGTTATTVRSHRTYTHTPPPPLLPPLLPRAGAGVHQGSPGRLKHEVFLAPVPNHAMFDALLAALCDPFIPARVVAIGMATGSQFLWTPHSAGIALSHAIFEYQRGFAIGLRAVRGVTIICIQPKN